MQRARRRVLLPKAIRLIPRKIRVLVVDDSAFARKVVREVLEASADIEVVGIARDGLDALEKIGELRPDVVTLDLVMPGLDGIGVLEALAARDDGPRVLVVSMSDGESDLAIRALERGAIDLVHKPTALATDRLYEMGAEIVQKVRIAASAGSQSARLRAAAASLADRGHEPRPPASRLLPARRAHPPRVVVIGTSTGGPQALTRLLGEIEADFPVPIAIALHMPVGYTEALAARLNGMCALEVIEARDDVVLRPGLVVVARAGMHLKLESRGGEPKVSLDFSPHGKPHRPSVDVLLASAAATFGADVLAVVLTGMGEDGLLGAQAVRAAGGVILTESESSCVVYGMPRAVHEAGLDDAQLPLDEVTRALRALV